MAPSTRSAPALTPALDAALEQLDALAGSPLGQVPTTTVVVLDRELRIRLATGLGWWELGVDPDTLIGLRMTDFAPPEGLAVALPHYAAVLAGEPRQFAFPLPGGRPTGSPPSR